MICDLHVHVAGVGTGRSGNYLSQRFRAGLPCKLILRRLGVLPGLLGAPDCDQQISTLLLREISKSCLHKAVLLAFDAAYREDGTRDDDHTLMVADNGFVADLAARSPKTWFGASVHPYRADAVEQLEHLIARGARLVKWLPCAQNIQLDHPRCFPFYEILAACRVPLLCHTGDEHTLKVFPDSLNHPKRLVPALERGVTVIAAHCGTSLTPFGTHHFAAWQDLAMRYDNLFGDISAFGVITRIRAMKTLLRSPRLLSKCVYGSDFPVPPMPLTCVPVIGLRAALTVNRIRNPFDQAVALMRAAGVPDEVFERGAMLLAGRDLQMPKRGDGS